VKPRRSRGALLAVTVAAVGLALLAGGCAATPPPAAKHGCELVMAFDDGRPTGTVAFPSSTYESVMRFELPGGEHRPVRLRFQAAAPGALAITVYDSTPLETPGAAILSLTRELAAAELSDGHDGRWVVEDLGGLRALKGVVWVGLRKVSGEPTVWASAVVSGQAFVRNNDPKDPIDLLPVKRTPMVRLELVP
jgi:hypothetical protein